MFPYESLEVYKKAFQFNQEVYRLLKSNTTIPSYLKNQLGRASMRIMLNIAEGSAKFSVKDRRNFFITARGSAFECAAIIKFLAIEKEIVVLAADDFNSVMEEVSKMLFAMIKNLEK